MTARGRFAGLLARLTGQRQLEQLAALDEKVTKFGRAHREEMAAQRQGLDELRAEIATRAGASAVRDLHRRVDDVQTSLTRQDRTICDALERAGRLDEQGVDDRRFARRLEMFLRHDRPIVVGPWTGEVGFELLYWIPFVRWAVGCYGLPSERVVVVSRGGTEAWYGGLASRYDDVFSYFTPEEFRQATEEAKKQRGVGAFDAQVLKRAIETHRLDRPALLHPGMMYRLFMPFWKDLATVARVERYTQHVRLSPPAAPGLDDRGQPLPERYVAARFYFSDCFPDTPANRTFVASTVEAISRHTPVVLLDLSFSVDDHRDFVPPGCRVVTVGRHVPPERNLAVQTAVVAGATAFVGTYGGYSYLAPLLGVGALAFFSEQSFKRPHLELAERVFARLGGATFVPLDVASLPLVRLGISEIATVAP